MGRSVPTGSGGAVGPDLPTVTGGKARLAALIAGSIVTIAGVLLFGWGLELVVFLLLLEACCSALGLVRTVVLHRRATGDPAHHEEQFTGWLRLRFQSNLDFADGLLYRTLSYPSVFLMLVTLALVSQASGPLSAAIPVAISAIAVGLLAYGETATLRRRVAEVPFALLRAQGIAMVYRAAGVTVLCIAGLVWVFGWEQPVREAVVGFVVLKTAMEAWLMR